MVKSFVNWACGHTLCTCRLLNIVGGLNHDYIIWQEVIDNGAKVRDVYRSHWAIAIAKATSEAIGFC